MKRPNTNARNQKDLQPDYVIFNYYNYFFKYLTFLFSLVFYFTNIYILIFIDSFIFNFLMLMHFQYLQLSIKDSLKYSKIYQKVFFKNLSLLKKF